MVAALLEGLGLWLQWWWLIGVTAFLWLAFAAFFRDPLGRRPASAHPNDFISPADGRISAVLRVDHHAAVDGPALVVRIFLSVLNVHVNRMPCAGTVVDVQHTPGRYLDARTEESAKVNESSLLRLRRADGLLIGVRQVSGAIARRIVCAAAAGEQFSPGQRYGMIKFGSTTELILPRPDRARVHVQKGDRVVGGVTLLATLAVDVA